NLALPEEQGGLRVRPEAIDEDGSAFAARCEFFERNYSADPTLPTRLRGVFTARTFRRMDLICSRRAASDTFVSAAISSLRAPFASERMMAASRLERRPRLAAEDCVLGSRVMRSCSGASIRMEGGRRRRCRTLSFCRSWLLEPG